jgi:hypothetical protein
MPLNWKALYSQIPRLAEAEVERRLRLAEQASAYCVHLSRAAPGAADDQRALGVGSAGRTDALHFPRAGAGVCITATTGAIWRTPAPIARPSQAPACQTG